MRKIFLFTIISVAILCLYTLNSHELYAAEAIAQWGPHLKDYGNSDMMGRVRNEYRGLGGADDTWIPFTVMVPGATNDSEKAETTEKLKTIFRAAYIYKMIPIIRVTSKYCTGGWERLDNKYTTLTREAFNNASGETSGIPGPIFVEWGNEVNFAYEWGNNNPNPGNYGAAFVSFKSSLSPVYTAVKAALANGSGTIVDPKTKITAVMDSDTFYAGLNSSVLSGGIASHPYEIDPNGADRYNINNWRYDRSKYAANLPIILTEFGLAPAEGRGFGQRIEFVQRKYKEEKLYQNESQIKYVTPLLIDNQEFGGTNQTKIIIFGPGGSTSVIDPIGSSTSIGGGTCDPPIAGTLTLACYKEGDALPDESDLGCSIKGHATTTVLIPRGNGTFERKDMPITGMGVAWIERMLNSKNSTSNATYSYTTTELEIESDKPDPNNKEVGRRITARYKLENLPCSSNIVVAAFCGGRVLQNVPLSNNLGGGQDINFDFSENINCDFNAGYCTCSNNNYCARTPIKDDAAPFPTADGQQHAASLLWNKPAPTPRSNTGVSSFVKQCLTHPLECASTIVEVSLGGELVVEPKVVVGERDTMNTMWEMGYGCVPQGATPSCDDIRRINKESSGINLGRCGRSLVMSGSPHALAKMARDAEAKMGDWIVCKDNDGKDVRYKEIQKPQEALKPSHSKSVDFFPYYKLAQRVEEGDMGLSEGKVAPNASTTKGDDTILSCGGTYRADGTSCKPTEEGPEAGTTVTSVTLRQPRKLAYLVQDDYAKRFSRPNKDFTRAFEGRALTSGVSRGATYGKEYVCPPPNKAEEDPNDPDNFKCLQGGIKLELITVLSEALAKKLESDCADPDSNSCKIESSVQTEIIPTLPYTYIYSALVPSYLRRPGKEMPFEGQGGAVAGNTAETKELFTFSSDTSGTPSRAAEEIMKTFRYKDLHKRT